MTLRLVSHSIVATIDKGARRLALLFALAMMTSACAGTADWANPGSWWQSDEPKQAAEAKPVPGSDQPYPRLSDAPRQAPATTTAETRRQIADGLVADRENARYSDQQLRAHGADAVVPVRRTAEADANTATAVAPAAAPAAVPAQPQTAMAAAVPSPAQTVPAPTNTRPMSVPSIVQRGAVRSQPVPSSVEEVSRRPADRLVQASPPAPAATSQPAPAAPAPVAAAPSPQPVVPAPAPQPPRTLAQATPTAPAAPVALHPPAPPAAPIDEDLVRSLPIGDDQAALLEAFAASIAQQKAASGPVAGGYAFEPASARPIKQWGASVPPVVRESYNRSITTPAQAPAVADGPTSFLPSGTPSGSTPVTMTSFDADDTVSARPPAVASTAMPDFDKLAAIEPAGGPMVVHFAHGSSRLSREARRELQSIARTVASIGRPIRVVGHSSQRTGDMPYSRHKDVNFRMSENRARAVAQELQRQGVAQELILVEARGDEEPIYYEFMPAGEAQNRRVEVILQ